MASWIDAVAYWLIDYYLAATALLAIVAISSRVIGQPARRMAVVWGGCIGLLLLAVLCALPGWPRFDMLADAEAVTASSDSVATVPAERAVPAQPARIETQSPTVANRSEGPQPVPPAATHGSAAAAKARPSNAASLPQTAIANHGAPSASTRAATPGIFERMLRSERFGLKLHWVHVLAVCVFLTGSALATFRVLHGVISVRRWCRLAAQAPANLTSELARIVGKGDRCPQLLMSPMHPVPIATGTVRPIILMPWQFADADRMNDCRSVLAHEWAHIRNGDLWLLAIDRWLLPVLWAHPAFLWLRRSIRNDQELLADVSAAVHSNPADYAQMLVKCARQLVAERQALQVSTALGVWDRPSRLALRIAKLLHQGPRVEPHCTRLWRVGSLALLASVPVFLSTATVCPSTLPGFASSTPKSARGAEPRRIASTVTQMRAPSQPGVAEESAIAEVRRLGGGVKFDPSNPYAGATEVNMVYRFTEEGIRVENGNLTEQPLPQIAKLRNLRVLALAGHQATDESMRHLAGLSRLERLCLWDARYLTDDAVAAISALPALKALEISNAPIDDSAIERLAGVRSLEELSVQGSRLTGRSLAYAARLPALRRLLIDLGESPADGDMLSVLRDAPALRQLGLQCSALADDGLKALAGIESLQVLCLGECAVSTEGLMELRTALPALDVITPRQNYPALASGTSPAQCEASIRHSQAAVALVRKFLKRIGSGQVEAAVQMCAAPAEAHDVVENLRRRPAIANVEWTLAFTDAENALAVSTEFSGPFGAEQVFACQVKCVGGDWKISHLAVVGAREGVASEVRQFAATHPRAHSATGWLPYRAETD